MQKPFLVSQHITFKYTDVWNVLLLLSYFLFCSGFIYFQPHWNGDAKNSAYINNWIKNENAKTKKAKKPNRNRRHTKPKQINGNKQTEYYYFSFSFFLFFGCKLTNQNQQQQIVNDKITQFTSQLYTYRQMLPTKREEQKKKVYDVSISMCFMPSIAINLMTMRVKLRFCRWFTSWL